MHSIKFFLTVATVVSGMGVMLAPHANAAITLTGTNSPNSTGGADPWNVGGALTIGAAATVGMTIDGGSDVSNTTGTLADGTLATRATVTVDGAGSTWTNSDILTFGSYGTLNIKNGGLVIATKIEGGDSSGSLNFDGGTLRITTTDPTAINVDLRAGGGTLDIPTAADTFYVFDIITGDGGLTKTGAGTLYLGRPALYHGNTTVSAGTLDLAPVTGSFDGSPTITVASGATLEVSNITLGANSDGTRFMLASGQTLKGNGTVVGAMAVGAGAIVAPGESIGTLATDSVFFTNLLNSQASAGTFNPELNFASGGSADLLNVAGTVTINNAILNLSFLNLTSLTSPMTFLLIQNDGEDPISGGGFGYTLNFAGYATTPNYAFSGTDSLGRIGDGNDFAVTISANIVPEPNSFAMLLTATAALWRRRRVPHPNPLPKGEATDL